MKTLLLSLLAIASAGGGELNLVPKIRTTFDEGGQIKRLTFEGSEEDHQLTIDSELAVEPLPNGVRLTFHKLISSVFQIRATPAPKNLAFTPENIPTYAKCAAAQLPPEAQNIEQTEEIPEPHPINGWKSHRFTFSYTLNQAKFQASITFLNLLNGPQILLETRAPSDSFKAALMRSDMLTRSWYTLKHG